jgi:hypothetical protein
MSNPPFRYFKIQISYNEIPLDKTRSDVKQIVCICKLIYYYVGNNNRDVTIVWCDILQSPKQADIVGKKISYIYHDHYVYYV